MDGIPERPNAPFVISKFKKITRTTSPNPSVAMARYKPLRRVVGKPIITATRLATKPPIIMPTTIGKSAFKERIAPTYAPTLIKPAAPKESCPLASVK